MIVLCFGLLWYLTGTLSELSVKSAGVQDLALTLRWDQKLTKMYHVLYRLVVRPPNLHARGVQHSLRHDASLIFAAVQRTLPSLLATAHRPVYSGRISCETRLRKSSDRLSVFASSLSRGVIRPPRAEHPRVLIEASGMQNPPLPTRRLSLKISRNKETI